MFRPTPDQSIRLSPNPARPSRPRTSTTTTSDQNIQFPTPVDLTPLKPLLPAPLQPLVPPPFLLTVNAFGNPSMKEQSTDAYEIAPHRVVRGEDHGRARRLPWSDTNDNINFTYLYPPGTPGYPPPTYYGVTNPAKGVTLPTATTPPQAITLNPILMGILAQVPAQFGGPIQLPEKAATYLNLGPTRNRGIEASIDHRFNAQWSVNGNYSWQDTPQILDADSGQIPYPVSEVGLPSEHRFNASLGYAGKKLFGNVGVNYASEALWVDVLNASYAGFTDAYTMVNATLGVKLAGGKVTLSLKSVNLTNEKIQQHIFGDILKRSVVAELRYFAK